MRYDNLRAFEKHLEGAKLLRFSPLYFILGKDPTECQEAIDLLLQFLLPPPKIREIALSSLDASQLEESDLSEALLSQSLFSDVRVIWIQAAEKLKKTVQEKLIKYFSHPISSQYLLLSASGWQKNTTFYKAAEKEGVLLDFADMKPWEKEKSLTEWINKEATSAQKIMPYQVCQALVKRVGNDRVLLAQEFEKLLCFCSDKKELTLEDVEAICVKHQVESIWQFGEALFRRDTAAALQMAQTFLLEGQPLLPLLRQIRSQFQTDYQICLMLAHGKQAQDISHEFPYLKGQLLDRRMRQAQQYGLNAFKRGLLALDATELRAKNSAIEEKILIELLVIQLTTPPFT